jgi:phosphomannomutase
MLTDGLAEAGVVIGYDTRFLSAEFAAACAEVMAGNGIRVFLTREATPTPVISYDIAQRHAGGGIIVTASHNPAEWNGLKFKSGDGASAPVEVVCAIEKQIATLEAGQIKSISLKAALQSGILEWVDLYPAYEAQVGRLLDLNALKQSNLNVVVDSMYGAGAGYFKRLLAGGNMLLNEINAEHNPAFPGIRQPEPIGVNLGKLAEQVTGMGAGVGLATDGDADRLGIIDEQGHFLTQLQVYALLALYLLEVRGERGPIVKTITTTSMLYRLGEQFGIPVFEVPVGFKYVAPVMLRENAIIGGEESGGYGFRGHVPERDGLLAGLFFLDLMARTGKTPSQLADYLFSKVGPHYYDRVDVHFAPSERETIIERLRQCEPAILDGSRVIKKDPQDGFRFILEDGCWLLIRFSGTEPLLRIYTETGSSARVGRMLAIGADLAGVNL